MKIYLDPPAINKSASTTWTKRLGQIFEGRNISVTYRLDDFWDAALFIGQPSNLDQALDAHKPVGFRVANGYLPDWFVMIGKPMKPSHHLANAAISSGLQNATVVIYQSAWAKQQLDKFLVPRHNAYRIISNGVNLKLFSPDWNKRPTVPVLGTVGAFRYRFRLETFFEVSRRLGVPHRLLIVGSLDSECKKVLKSYSQDPEIRNRLEWIDFVSHSHLPALYNRMSLLIHPVMGDACPNVVCEALACGLPVVAPEFGGTSELLGRGGIAFSSLPWKYDDYFINQMTEATMKALVDIKILSLAARLQANEALDIELMADHYLMALGLPMRVENIFSIPKQPKENLRTKGAHLLAPARFYASLAMRKIARSRRKLAPTNKIPKIAFTLFDFQVGGIENWLYRLAVELQQEFDFYFLATRQPDFLPKFERIGQCQFLPNPLVMMRYLQKEHVDLVQVHNERWPVDAALSAGVPKVIERLGGQRSWRRISKSGLNLVIASSQMAARAISDLVSPEKIRVIYNGINLFEIETSLPQRFYSSEQTILGRATRFGRGQNLSLLIHSLEKLLPLWPDLRLVLVGDDSSLPGAEPIYAELTHMVKELNLINFIHFTGRVDDAIPLTKGFDIGTCVSNDEGLPNSLIEAMACKKPVISTNVGAITELIQDGENGLLFPAGDLSAFCYKVESLLTDRKMIDLLAHNAFQTIHDRFNIKISARQYAEAYRELLDK